MKKRIISLLLALVMLFGVLPVAALAESDDDAQNVAEQSLIGDLKEGWDSLKGTLSDFFDPGHGPGPGDYDSNTLDENRKVKWNQFYGFVGSDLYYWHERHCEHRDAGSIRYLRRQYAVD